MAKRQSSQTPTSSKRSIHFDALADGVLDALATARKSTNSEIVCQLIIAELYRLQGTEKEAVRAILKHQGIDIPRRNSGSATIGQGPPTDEPLDGVATRNERIGAIVETALEPLDAAIDAVTPELSSMKPPRPTRFGSSN